LSNEGIKEKVSGQPWWVVFVEGIVALVRVFRGADWGVAILGIMANLIGIFLLANTLIGIKLTVTLSGIVLVVGGIAAIVMSFRMDDSSSQGAQV